MLKSTFKKVSAIAIAGTMLAGMMAVPANAMTEVMEEYQAPAWSENFNSYEDASKSIRWNGSAITTTSFVEGKIEYDAKEWADVTMAVTGETDKELKIKNNFNGNQFNIKLLTGQITLPDNLSSNISFDASISEITDMTGKTGNDAGKGVESFIGVNDTKLISFTHAANKAPTDNTTVKVVGSSNSVEITPGTTYSFNVAIDNDIVTLTIKDGESVIGTSAAKISGISSISNILFNTNGYKRGYTLIVDNINITTGAERGTGEFTSDLSKTVLEEDFTNFTGVESGKLQGTSFTLARPWGSGDFTVTNVGGAAKTSVTNSTLATLTADFDDVALGEGEVIRFSFDITKDAGVWASIGSTSLASPNIFLTTLDGKRTSELSSDNTNIKMHYIRDGRIHPGRLQTVIDAMMLDGYTYHFEYTIVPSNPAHGNKQTLTVNVTSPDNALTHTWQTTDRFSQYKETFYMDADRDTEGEQKFDSLSKFYFGNYYSTADGTIDNLKVEVIKPGFEVVDVNNSTNTYTFSGTDQIDLNYVTNASADSKVIVAQYDNTKRLIKAEPADVAASGRGTVTVTPVEGAQTIKLMVLDMSTAMPYAKVFKLTKSGN